MIIIKNCKLSTCGREEEADCYISPNQPVVDPDHHSNAAHAAMTNINNYI